MTKKKKKRKNKHAKENDLEEIIANNDSNKMKKRLTSQKHMRRS